MEIIVKGRHTTVSDRFRDHVSTKLAKIQRLDNKLIRVDVEVSKDPNHRMSGQRERVELTIHSRGPAIRAEACADDRFSALDIALGKLEERLRRLRDRRKIHHGKSCPPSVAEITAVVESEQEVAWPAAAPVEALSAAEISAEIHEEPGEHAEPIVPIEMDGDGPLVVREKFHKADPITIDQALLEMELVGHDFFLFRDKEGGLPSVVYRRRGYNYGVLRLVEG
ncbi:ribosome-associated translation inhibitor RaiA [Microbispora corallina]|uniref:Ribosome hibernation promoting factor n=1 Tax=Microbispora corallina TaxID=83302 RepID=A0ABQ4G938_9ACTN|nr:MULTISPECIES: ribosome-associated translation inhibitor RaiA [Microbispora]ETK33577.1 30S ribosomal protein S30 [Microbispora sp. ATCC PTA-5024]GIH43598.1 ribosomal subunit interface protein [Microbispora corallina]